MIIADAREPKKILERLRKYTDNLDVVSLDVCDYLVTGGNTAICIERKDAQDFLSSILDGRLMKQSARMLYGSEYIPILVVEGCIGRALRHVKGVGNQHLVGALAKLTVAGVSIVSLPGPDWVARYIVYLDSKLENGDTVVSYKPGNGRGAVDPRAYLRAVVQSIRGIGKRKAEKIAERYGSMQELVLDCGDRLKGVIDKSSLENLRKAVGCG